MFYSQIPASFNFLGFPLLLALELQAFGSQRLFAGILTLPYIAWLPDLPFEISVEASISL
jgi:hypothetical protein